MPCQCAKLKAHPIERVDQAPTGKVRDAVIDGCDLVAEERFRWRSVYRCRHCGQLWGETAWTSGMMDIFYLMPVETDDPARWAKESEDELAAPMRRQPPRPKRKRRRSPVRKHVPKDPDVQPPSTGELGTTMENVHSDPSNPHSPWARVPILSPAAELERKSVVTSTAGTSVGVAGPVRHLVFAPRGDRFAFVDGGSSVILADETLEDCVCVGHFDWRTNRLRCLGFDEDGSTLAIGTGERYHIRDVGEVQSGCGWRTYRVDDGALLEERETADPVITLPTAFTHGDPAPDGSSRHVRSDGLIVKWGEKAGDMISTWRGRSRVAELVVDTWPDAPPRIDEGGRRVWTFAHGRTTVFDVATGEVLCHARRVPPALRPPRRAPSREARIAERKATLIPLGRSTTILARRHALSIYRGAKRVPTAWTKSFGLVLGVSKNERWLVTGGPRAYRVYDLARA